MSSIVGTELEAVQEILFRTGSDLVPESLTTDLSKTTGRVLRILQFQSATIQGAGWHFNTEKVRLEPGVDAHITFPPSTLRLYTKDPGVEAEPRGDRLYNLRDQTFQWDRSVVVEMVLHLDWGCIPFMFRRWITMEAARLYLANQRQDIGKGNNPAITNRHRQIEADVVKAMVEAKKHDQDGAKRSVPTTLNELYAKGLIRRPPVNT